MESRGDQVAHAVDLFPFPVDNQETRPEQLTALPRTEVRPDNHLHHPALVFQGQKPGVMHGFARSRGVVDPRL